MADVPLSGRPPAAEQPIVQDAAAPEHGAHVTDPPVAAPRAAGDVAPARAPQAGEAPTMEPMMRNSAHLLHPADSEFDEVGETSLDHLVAELITGLGEDISREGLLRTPQRVERSLRYLMSGYDVTVREVLNGALFEAEGSEMVVVKGIEFFSLCEHHMLPFFGHAAIAYIPNRTILGLSKFARVVDVFARRMQVQERMTSQIADALVEVLEPRGIAVVTEASHLCMMMRGVEKQGSTTRTSAMRGVFKSDARTRQEFLEALR